MNLAHKYDTEDFDRGYKCFCLFFKKWSAGIITDFLFTSLGSSRDFFQIIWKQRTYNPLCLQEKYDFLDSSDLHHFKPKQDTTRAT